MTVVSARVYDLTPQMLFLELRLRARLDMFLDVCWAGSLSRKRQKYDCGCFGFGSLWGTREPQCGSCLGGQQFLLLAARVVSNCVKAALGSASNSTGRGPIWLSLVELGEFFEEV